MSTTPLIPTTAAPIRTTSSARTPVHIVAPSLACLLTAACTSPTPQPPDLSQTLHNSIQQHAASAHTHEFPTTRIVSQSDLNQDGLPDTVLVYRLEGDPTQDGFEQYLTAAITSPSHRPPLLVKPVLVGAHGKASISGLRVLPGIVELNTLEYLPTDPSCCPTGRGLQSWSWKPQQGFQKLSPAESQPQPSPPQKVTK